MLLPLIALFTVTSGNPHSLPREQFVALYEKVQVGDSMASVRKVLGNPDDVRNPGESTENWAWGTNGHLTLPTRGSVEFDDQKRLKRIRSPLLDGRDLESDWESRGGNSPGDDPSSRRNHRSGRHVGWPTVHWKEPELVRLLRALDRIELLEKGPGFRFPSSLELIRGANLLIPLGEDKAISLLLEYDQLTESDQSVFPFELLHCLYVPKSSTKYLPAPGIGWISPPRPHDPSRVPAYPIWIQQDIPINICFGILLSGLPATVDMDVAAVRKSGVFRSRPLVPPKDVFRAVSDAERALLHTGMYSGVSPGFAGSKESLHDQVNDSLRSLLTGLVAKDQPVKPFSVRWDSRRQCYVRG